MEAVNSHDIPLNCNWKTSATSNWRIANPADFDFLDLAPAWSRAAEKARAGILAQALAVGRANRDDWISYSRNSSFYSKLVSRYWAPWFTFATVPRCVDALAALGLLNHMKMPPGHRDKQSRFRASEKLLELKSKSDSKIKIIHERRELLVLRDIAGTDCDYRDTRRSDAMRRDLEKINRFIAGGKIGLNGVIVSDGDPVDRGDGQHFAACNQLHRVFNRGSFSLGGRLYGGWWLGTTSGRRAEITIGGAATIELDYPSLHIQLLYAYERAPMPAEPYALPNWPRHLVKLGLLIMINADTMGDAVKAVAQEIRGPGAFARARALVAEISTKHAGIANQFGSGSGLWLQGVDGDMAVAILLRLARLGIVALPVHDSFRVLNRKYEVENLKVAMAETLQNTLADLAKIGPSKRAKSA